MTEDASRDCRRHELRQPPAPDYVSGFRIGAILRSQWMDSIYQQYNVNRKRRWKHFEIPHCGRGIDHDQVTGYIEALFWPKKRRSEDQGSKPSILRRSSYTSVLFSTFRCERSQRREVMRMVVFNDWFVGNLKKVNRNCGHAWCTMHNLSTQGRCPALLKLRLKAWF